LRTNRLIFFGVVLASSTLACGAILGFPDETKVDPNFGQTDGGGPDVTLPDGAVLDGSPPDGSTADSPFPTDAPVVSPDGACNCFGGTCNGDVCQPVAIVTGQTDPNFIDTDDTTVFFASGGQTILAVDPNNVDAGVRKITNKLEPSINDLRARSGYVYFTNLNGNTNAVSRCSGTVGCVADRSEYSVPARKSYGVAVDGTKVYYSASDLQGSGGGIWSCTQVNCTTATRILPRDYPGVIVTNGTTLAWIEGSAGAGVVQCGTSGGSFSQNNETAIVDLTYGPGSDVYFVKSSSLWRQIGLQAAKQMGSASNAVAVRADASYVYWLNGGGSGSLMRCPVATDCLAQPNLVTTLASGLQNPFGLALSNDSVYFTTRNDLKVWRLRK